MVVGGVRQMMRGTRQSFFIFFSSPKKSPTPPSSRHSERSSDGQRWTHGDRSVRCSVAVLERVRETKDETAAVCYCQIINSATRTGDGRVFGKSFVINRLISRERLRTYGPVCAITHDHGGNSGFVVYCPLPLAQLTLVRNKLWVALAHHFSSARSGDTKY